MRNRVSMMARGTLSCGPWRIALLTLGLTGSATIPAADPTEIPEPRAPWSLELIAEAPQVRHPTVVCTAPDGRIFVAEDPMDITAPADATLGRILCRHGDGHWTIFATNLHAVFGLQYLEGRVYALHNPTLSVFDDIGGVGHNRQDILEQTLPNPWALDWNDHVPANFRLGMDGSFHVAIGDKGLYGCVGRDGSRVDLHGGGILRLRPDGTRLEIFSTGVRNILDVAMNDEDELFTYDNTDEHQWMGRLTHMMDGGFYGYPHDFVPRRPYTLWMMADFGAGAACGAIAGTDDALPAEYRGNLFLSDFGKRQVIRVRIERQGATFRVVESEELFRNPPADFRPVGINFTPDGTGLYICDWRHRDVKENVEVGRLWKLQWTGPTHAEAKPSWYPAVAMNQPSAATVSNFLHGLRHSSRDVRLTAQRALVARELASRKTDLRSTQPIIEALVAIARDRREPPRSRWHALWALAELAPDAGLENVFVEASADPEPSVARQAIRAIGQRRMQGALETLVPRLADPDASIRFHVATALGHLGDRRVVSQLIANLSDREAEARYATFTALHRIGRSDSMAWPEVVRALGSASESMADGAAYALRDTFSVELVSALSDAARDTMAVSNLRVRALSVLAGLRHQPPEWHGEWWAYHPAKAPPPRRTRHWEGTDIVLTALRHGLQDRDSGVRRVAAQGLQESGDPASLPLLRALLESDTDSRVRRAALTALAAYPDPGSAPLVARAMAWTGDEALAADAIRAAPHFPLEAMATPLLQHLRAGDDRPRLSELAAVALGKMRATNAVPALVATLATSHDGLTLAILAAFGQIGGETAVASLKEAVTVGNAEVRHTAIRSLGTLKATQAVPLLLKAWSEEDMRREALEALVRIRDARAVEAYLSGLTSADAAERQRCLKVLESFRKEALAWLESQPAAAPPVMLAELRKLYAEDQAALASPIFKGSTAALEPEAYARHALPGGGRPGAGRRLFFDERGVACARCHRVQGNGGVVGPDLTLAGTQFSRAELIDSVLNPSRTIREGYQQVVVESTDGEVVSGAMKADTADGVTLIDASGQVHVIPRSQVVSRDTSALSLMPEGLHLGLDLQEFADLIAFLESCRTQTE